MKKILSFEKSHIQTSEDYKKLVDIFCDDNSTSKIRPAKLFQILSEPEVTYLKFIGSVDDYIANSDKYFVFDLPSAFKFTVTECATLDDAGKIVAYTVDKYDMTNLEYCLSQKAEIESGTVIVEALIVGDV